MEIRKYEGFEEFSQFASVGKGDGYSGIDCAHKFIEPVIISDE